MVIATWPHKLSEPIPTPPISADGRQTVAYLDLGQRYWVVVWLSKAVATSGGAAHVTVITIVSLLLMDTYIRVHFVRIDTP